MAEPSPTVTAPIARKLRKVDALLKAGDTRQAADLCTHLLQSNPDNIDLLLLASHIHQGLGELDDALALAARARAVRPDGVDTRARLAECLLYCSEIGAAVTEARNLEAAMSESLEVLLRLPDLYQRCGQYEDALRCQLQAMRLKPDDARIAFDAASSCVALGRVDDAEKLYDRAIFLDPNHYEAREARSALRPQTLEANHARQFGFLLEKLPADDPGRIPVYYGLSKEFEDLGEYDTAFDCLRSGATLQRKAQPYDVAEDESTMAGMAEVFDRRRLAAADPGFEDASPIFLVGLPRIGVALANRLFASLDGIDSVGPVNTLIFALIHGIGAHRNAGEIVTRSADVDFRSLGERYWRGVRQLRPSAVNVLDCTPMNFQYLGLVSKALPKARVIHLRRHPLDSCYTLYRTNFHHGLGFTNSLADIGRHYTAYHRLMGHWRRNIPDWILDLDYETLVQHPEREIGRALAHLDIETALDESRLRALIDASIEAEAPLGVWKHYREQLAPLSDRLRANGVPVDDD